MATPRHTGEVGMHSPTSRRTRFGNIAIPITAFAFGLGLLSLSGHAQSNMTQAAGTQQSGASSNSKDAIRPFRVNIPEEQIVDLRKRIAATRWPDKELVTDESQGIRLAEVQELVRYWGTDYDWRKGEAKLNANTALTGATYDIDGGQQLVAR
jgi:hypothetical protein